MRKLIGILLIVIIFVMFTTGLWNGSTQEVSDEEATGMAVYMATWSALPTCDVIDYGEPLGPVVSNNNNSSYPCAVTYPGYGDYNNPTPESTTSVEEMLDGYYYRLYK